MHQKNDSTESKEEVVPLMGSWNRWYVLILAVLAVQILLYYLLTQAY